MIPDMPIDQIAMYIDALKENWELISVSVLAFIASLDKIALVAIKTLENIRNAWRDSFPKKEK